MIAQPRPHCFSRPTKFSKHIGTIAVALAFLIPKVQAQSVIISVPSTDITPKGELMLAHESQFNRFSGGKNYWNSFTFGTVGLTNKTEFAATLYGVARPSSGNNALGVGLKHKIFQKETHSGWHFEGAAGFMVPVSLSGKGTGYWGYGSFSARAPKTHTKVTVGPSFGTKQIFGKRTYSTIVGVEQPLTEKWSIVGDWFTGTHDLAAAIAGVSWRPKRELIIIAAWKVPNNARSGKPTPLIEVTYNFNLWR